MKEILEMTETEIEEEIRYRITLLTNEEKEYIIAHLSEILTGQAMLASVPKEGV